MKVPSLLIVVGFFAWFGHVVAAPTSSIGKNLKVPERSLPELISDLASEAFQVRENASRSIWQMGEVALVALQESAQGNDPEQTYRANELIRKIQLHITPDTDPIVTSMVERYIKANSNEKVILFDQMHKRRAWRQLLKLYAGEADLELKSLLWRSVEGVAVIAARERLVLGDNAGAREFLEMARADASGLMALADFYRSQGILIEELKRVQTQKGLGPNAWLLALYRASGNLEAARDTAKAGEELAIAAVMSSLLGDPLPWLRLHEKEKGDFSYEAIAMKRWLGKEIRPADLEPWVKLLDSKKSSELENSMLSLFLLGYPFLAEKGYHAASRVAKFHHLESLERIPESFEALDLDTLNPDYTAWVETRFKRIFDDENEREQEQSSTKLELILLANFLERRGLDQANENAFLKPLSDFSKKNEEGFIELLTHLFRGGASSVAPDLALSAGVAWVGDRAERWDELVTCAIGNEEEASALWNWLSELEPHASSQDRFKMLLALCGVGRDPRGLRVQGLARAWAVIDETPEIRRIPFLKMMGYSLDRNPDVVNHLRLWDLLPDSLRATQSKNVHIAVLSAAGRWEEATLFFQKLIDEMAAAKSAPEPSLHACLAACLRQAGKEDLALAQDRLVDTLSLGSDAVAIANGYVYGGDYRRAVDWLARGVRQSNPGSPEFFNALQQYGEILKEDGKWLEVGAIAEVLAQMSVSYGGEGIASISAMRMRFQSDLGRALGTLKNDRSKAIALLKRCHEQFPCDGSLADDFFPVLRKVGLLKEHDEWFAISWNQMVTVIEQFPDCDNTCNTAAWLASRAMRKLEKASEYAAHALAINPEQSAYLDTMGEVEFAKGNRENAIEWSTQAINFMPTDSMLRRQHERFRSGALPR